MVLCDPRRRDGGVRDGGRVLFPLAGDVADAARLGGRALVVGVETRIGCGWRVRHGHRGPINPESGAILLVVLSLTLSVW